MNSFFRAHMSGKQSAHRCEVKSTIEFATNTYIYFGAPHHQFDFFSRARRLLNATCPSVPTTHRKINKSPLSSSSLVYGVQKHSHIHNTLAVRRRGRREVFVRSTKRRDNICAEKCAVLMLGERERVLLFEEDMSGSVRHTVVCLAGRGACVVAQSGMMMDSVRKIWIANNCSALGVENDREQRLSKYLFMSDTDGAASLSSPASIFKAWKCPAGRHNSTSRLVVEQLLANEKPMCVLMGRGGGLGVVGGVVEASVPSKAYTLSTNTRFFAIHPLKGYGINSDIFFTPYCWDSHTAPIWPSCAMSHPLNTQRKRTLCAVQ